MQAMRYECVLQGTMEWMADDMAHEDDDKCSRGRVMSSWMQDGHRPHRTLPRMPNGLESVPAVWGDQAEFESQVPARDAAGDTGLAGRRSAGYCHLYLCLGQNGPHYSCQRAAGPAFTPKDASARGAPQIEL